ncbi:hypothetical protein A9Q93_05520 [Nonlabens dokdonensis]|uniref:Uncharacterized protein n=1 Tax=Nonlabens dokdonensis TaxID=328515 RepID=A0A1Z8B277_9FLAO|nr:hypothetical protein [Nonlabens dokdonensis]OUS16675.1 hypothetical protein A9Q93_05520 [Nonlabens dokdonensis]
MKYFIFILLINSCVSQNDNQDQKTIAKNFAFDLYFTEKNYEDLLGEYTVLTKDEIIKGGDYLKQIFNMYRESSKDKTVRDKDELKIEKYEVEKHKNIVHYEMDSNCDYYICFIEGKALGTMIFNKQNKIVSFFPELHKPTSKAIKPAFLKNIVNSYQEYLEKQK